MNILLFNASNSSHSINGQLLEATRSLLSGHNITFKSSADFDLPIYSIDIEEQKGLPEGAKTFYDLIASHDAVILASPEHNGLMPAVFKNIFDWASRYTNKQPAKMFAEKPVLLLSTSPGAKGGASGLELLAHILPFQGATIVDKVSISDFNNHFSNGKADDETVAKLKQAVTKLLDSSK